VRVAIGCIAVAGLAALTALSFLAASIYPAKFVNIAPAQKLLDYALGLDRDEGESTATDALVVLKGLLAHQYAVASHFNRRRALWRSIAGLATLVGVSSIIALVATTTAYYVWR
jgi:hypothetical protein